MNLESIATLLEEAGLGAQGQNLFIHRMPDFAESGFVLREGYSGDWISYDYPGWFEGDLVLTYRFPAGDYAVAKEKMTEAVALLTLPYGGVVGDVEYKYMRPRQTPMTYPMSGGGQMEFVVYIDVCYLIV